MTMHTRSKLGPHCIGGSADAVRLLRDGLSPVVKVLDSWTGLADLAAALPHRPLVIGRKYEEPFDPAELFRLGANPIAEARRYFDAMPDGGGWEHHNVEGDGLADLLIAYARQSAYDDAASAPAPAPPRPEPVAEASMPRRVRLKPNPAADDVWNLRKRPDLEADGVVAQMPAGTDFVVVRRHGDFFQVSRSGSYKSRPVPAMYVHDSAVEVIE